MSIWSPLLFPLELPSFRALKSHICANSLFFFLLFHIRRANRDCSSHIHIAPFVRSHSKVPETHTTVLDLKKAIKRKYELNQKRSANRQQCAGHRNKQHRQSQKSSRKSCQPYSNSDVDHNTTKISWRYIWRTYYLEYNGEPLSDDRQLLNEYGVRNKSTLQFVKKVKYLRRSNSTKQRV